MAAEEIILEGGVSWGTGCATVDEMVANPVTQSHRLRADDLTQEKQPPD